MENMTENRSKTGSETVSKKRAYQFILLMGLVSLFGDITYEGARGGSGAYLAWLGASAGAVGFVAGLGEFCGYGLRLASGLIADRTRAYWAMTIVGYGMIFAIPLLAFAGHWQAAAFLLILERAGKAIRSPARDTILSYATKEVGRGWGFAIHEAMDQIGAVSGPLLLAFFIHRWGGFRPAFAFLGIPAVITVLILLVAKSCLQTPETLEPKISTDTTGDENKPTSALPEIFRLYVLLVFFNVAGFVNFQIIAYHCRVLSFVRDAQIPVLYAVAMGVDALAALAAGKMYDKKGLRVLFAAPCLAIATALFAFSAEPALVVMGVIFWGMVMGLHETVMRAAIADLTPPHLRGTSYGIFNMVYGFSGLAGGVLIGLLYDASPAFAVALAVILQVAALFVVGRLTKILRKS